MQDDMEEGHTILQETGLMYSNHTNARQEADI